MIIIVDGPKGSGKSTLVKQIQKMAEGERMKVELFKSIRPEDPFAQMHDVISQFLKTPDVIHICDRFSMTEYVFSVFHDRVTMPKLVEEIDRINQRLARKHALHFILSTDIEVIAKRLEKRRAEDRWDMPQELVPLIWKSALGIAPNAKFMPANDKRDSFAILRYIQNSHQFLGLKARMARVR